MLISMRLLGDYVLFNQYVYAYVKMCLCLPFGVVVRECVAFVCDHTCV